jgi:hypothetical protein
MWALDIEPAGTDPAMPDGWHEGLGIRVEFDGQGRVIDKSVMRIGYTHLTPLQKLRDWLLMMGGMLGF